MMHRPKVSILLPTYNRSHDLHRSIGSVLRQTFASWELIVIDDGSTDDTAHVLKKYRSLDARIRSIALRKNSGPSYARNAGILSSRGTYVTFLDSDDEYLPTHLEWRARFLDSNPSVDMLHGGLKVFGDSWVPDIHDPRKRVSIYDCVACGTFFAKKNVIVDCGMFHAVPYGEDYDLFQRIQAQHKVVRVHLPATYHYHRSTISLTTQHAHRHRS